MLHGEGAPKLQMDSLLKSYRYVHNINEWLAVKACDKFMCVNPIITERIRGIYPSSAHKIETQSTWVDTKLFKATPFPAGNGVEDRVCGTARPLQGALRSCSRPLRGCATSSGRASSSTTWGRATPIASPNLSQLRTSRSCTASRARPASPKSWRTSMPESSPRNSRACRSRSLKRWALDGPSAPSTCPQLESVIKNGVSGELVARSSDADDMAERLAEAFLRTRNKIQSGEITPGGRCPPGRGLHARIPARQGLRKSPRAPAPPLRPAHCGCGISRARFLFYRIFCDEPVSTSSENFLALRRGEKGALDGVPGGFAGE